MNKQLTDEDLNLAFKSADISRNIPGTGFSGLESFEANYININGSCFKNFRAYGLKKLCLHSCPKVMSFLVVLFYFDILILHIKCKIKMPKYNNSNTTYVIKNTRELFAGIQLEITT